MKLLLILTLTASLFAQREYNSENLYYSKAEKVWKKKFSDEIVSGQVYAKYGDQKVPLGKVVNGLQEGKWTEWYESGVKASEKNYLNNKQHGKLILYYESGEKKAEQSYLKGLAHGKTIHFHKNGKIEQKGTYKNGKLDGYGETFYENGTRKHEMLINNGQTYQLKEWDEEGNLTTEILYDKQGLNGSTTSYKQGRRATVAYVKNKKPHGVDTTFGATEDEIIQTIEWVNGKKNGYQRIYTNGINTEWTRYEDNVAIEVFNINDNLNFIEDSLLVYKILEKEVNWYEPSKFRVLLPTPSIYKTPNKNSILPLSTFSSLSNQYRIFPIERKDIYLLITNTENEAIGYVKVFDFILRKASDDREFKKQIERVDLRFREKARTEVYMKLFNDL